MGLATLLMAHCVQVELPRVALHVPFRTPWLLVDGSDGALLLCVLYKVDGGWDLHSWLFPARRAMPKLHQPVHINMSSEAFMALLGPEGARGACGHAVCICVRARVGRGGAHAECAWGLCSAGLWACTELLLLFLSCDARGQPHGEEGRVTHGTCMPCHVGGPPTCSSPNNECSA